MNEQVEDTRADVMCEAFCFFVLKTKENGIRVSDKKESLFCLEEAKKCNQNFLDSLFSTQFSSEKKHF